MFRERFEDGPATGRSRAAVISTVWAVTTPKHEAGIMGKMRWRRIRVGCDFTYVAEIGTPVIFQVQPVNSPQAAIEQEQWASEPPVTIRGYADLYGNPCVRTVLPAGKSSFRDSAVAVVPDATEDASRDAPECAPD